MESSRRPFDRSREPGLKKPRLADETGRGQSTNGRPIPQRAAAAAAAASASPLLSRFRTNERETEANDSVLGAYHPQHQQQQQKQQHQELVSQYKTALAELTFNSKPIITNLTIIAGENLHAAKSIAATVCANIIEVSSEQKLPSLYLLDSIVKNIGRDYIKYFAARLPEVFCKAYRQVDASVHPGMRHLFGTWKGVFPPQPLQMIEKELGFVQAVNGSSTAATTPKFDAQSQQRPQHSIHVNPKYLEAARQRLQQSSREKEEPSDITGAAVDSADVAFADRTTAISKGRPWDELPTNVHNIRRPQRETVSEPVHEKNIFGDKHGSDLPRTSETIPRQGNGYSVKRGFPNNPPTQSIASKSSWKNSEEEEYMWDDINPRLTDHGAPGSLTKGWSPPRDSGQMESENFLRKPRIIHEIKSRFDRASPAGSISLEQKEKPGSGHRKSPIWDPRLTDGPSHSSTGPVISGHSEGYPALLGDAYSIGRTGVGPQRVSISSHTRTPSFSFSTNAASPSGHSVVHQHHTPSPSIPSRSSHQPLAEQDQSLNLRTPQFSEPNISQYNQEPMSIQTQNFQPKRLQKVSSPSLPSIQLRNHTPSSRQMMSDHSDTLSSEIPEKSNRNNLLATGMESGLLSGIQPPLPFGPPPTQLTSSLSALASASLSGPSVATTLPHKKVERPPLPPGPPPLSFMGGGVEQTTNAASTVLNPISNLLSSLVAKGLISASETQPQTLLPPKPTLSMSTSTATVVSIPSPSSAKEDLSLKESAPKSSVSLSKHDPESSVALSPPAKLKIKNSIGFDFKPEIIRESHPDVICGLFDDLPYQCTVCGLRLKLQERLERHMGWHRLNKLSRRWYASSADWIEGRAGLESAASQSAAESQVENNEPMVPSDESQCVCLLCGELFEDFYSHEGDEWMFRGAVYMHVPSLNGERGPIVHADCVSETSAHDLGLPNYFKTEKDA